MIILFFLHLYLFFLRPRCVQQPSCHQRWTEGYHHTGLHGGHRLSNKGYRRWNPHEAITMHAWMRTNRQVWINRIMLSATMPGTHRLFWSFSEYEMSGCSFSVYQNLTENCRITVDKDQQVLSYTCDGFRNLLSSLKLSFLGALVFFLIFFHFCKLFLTFQRFLLETTVDSDVTFCIYFMFHSLNYYFFDRVDSGRKNKNEK